MNIGTLEDGRYTIDARGGVLSGTYQVEVDAMRKTGRKIAQEFNGEEIEVDEEFPIGSPEYAGEQSPLKVTVPGDQEQYNFDIPPA